MPKQNAIPSPRMKQFMLMIRKYFPKKSQFFYNGSHYQPSDTHYFESGNSKVLQRYKSSFFRSFCADSEASQPSKLPRHLRDLTIFAGSTIYLKKLIKQNQTLQHIVFESENAELNEEVLKYLKFSKNLLSIRFKRRLPCFSDTICQKMRKTWGNTIEVFSSLSAVHDQYHNDGESFKRVMETILKLPKLKKLELKSSAIALENYFPFEKLQERNIAYEVGFAAGRGSFDSLQKNSPNFKPTGEVVIQPPMSYFTLGNHRFKEDSKQTIFLYPGARRDWGRVFLLPVFQNIHALDLGIVGKSWDLSSLGQLNNLKHLSFNCVDLAGVETDMFEYLFTYLNENVAPHKKLETFLIRLNLKGQKKQNVNPALFFFEACSETLRKVHFESRYLSEKSDQAEHFYEGLSRLKSLQSLSISLDFQEFESKQQIEKISQITTGMKSLEELDFKILKKNHQEEVLNLRFPPELKKLSLDMNVFFNASKSFWSLPNLTHLELEFIDLISQKWTKTCHDIMDNLKQLSVLILKETQRVFSRNEMPEINEKLGKLMTEYSNLKLVIFANLESKGMLILRRNDYSWSKINLIIDSLSLKKDMKFNYIKSYE